MKKILAGLVILFCVFLNGCVPMMFVALSAGQAAQAQQIELAQASMIKAQRGIVFDSYLEYPNATQPYNTQPTPIPHVKVKSVATNSDAERAGFKVGDEVITLNDRSLGWGLNTTLFISGDDKPIKFTMHRGNDEYITFLNPL